MKYLPHTLLAILQQAEYDLTLWQRWLDQKRSQPEQERLATLQPERWTTKLKLIATLSQVFSWLLPSEKAISLSLRIIQPLESFVTRMLLNLAAHKLRRLQKDGLVVIAIAGSYGKTSVKHLTNHILSHQSSTLMSPASYNTPLGLALTILRQLDDRHDIFLAELGEYQVKDIDNFLNWIRPLYAILTPVGYAHGERFQSADQLVSTFLPLLTSKYAPATLWVDDRNRHFIPDTAKVQWYGYETDSDLQLTINEVKLNGSSGKISLNDNKTFAVHTRLLGKHQLLNALPAIGITKMLSGNIDTSVTSLAYAPDIPRRLSLTVNTNGSVLIDNSYNTNPGSWSEMAELLLELDLPSLAIITSGFVELSPTDNDQAHQQLASDLAKISNLVGVIRSRTNEVLIRELEKKQVTLITGNTLTEVLTQLSSVNQPIKYLWLEGGMRELYQ